MNTEEMSKLWSAFQAHYRPTAAYQVSVVMIEASQPSRAPLPVLSRGPVEPSSLDPTIGIERGVVVTADLTAPFPEIERITIPNARLAAHLGDTITIDGHHFDGSGHRVLLTLPRHQIERDLIPITITSTSLSFVVADVPADFPAGTYLISIEVVRPGETVPRSSSQGTLAIAPEITTLTSPPTIFTRDADGVATVTVGCKPVVKPAQRASLLLGGLEVVADPHPTDTSTLTFTVSRAPVGAHIARLRLDGIDSQIVDRAVSPPAFFNHRIEIA